jgi:hypothetical protein
VYEREREREKQRMKDEREGMEKTKCRLIGEGDRQRKGIFNPCFNSGKEIALKYV